MELSKRSLELLQTMFADNSPIQLPVGLAKEIIEIREWISEQIKILQPEQKGV